jgi:UDP-N-acetylglucosamine 2-epimerase (non-hydrolysing)/GDP/UDP-N,N'-diacetylbacillosamine 2-epimerase (hydrolysing)
VTLEENTSAEQFAAMLDAFDGLGDDVGIIFTSPNADTDGRVIIDMINNYVKNRPNAKAFTSLGQLKYLSAMAEVDAVVGNSSSGLYEAPSFEKATVDIGDRQKGRLKAASVISSGNNKDEIYEAIKKAFASDFKGVINPYGNGDAAKKIVSILKNTPDYRSLLKKHFYMA